MRFFGVIILATMMGNSALAAGGVERYAWNSRLLLVFADLQDQEPLRAQRADIAANLKGYRDRDLTAFLFVGGHLIESIPSQNIDLVAAELRRRFGLPADGFAVALIGKDTRVAFQSREPVGACQLFALIDGMPMRRSEIADSGGAVRCH